MANNYRQDTDLELLRYADQEMLGVLVNYLTTDKDGSTRYTESLTGDEAFKAANGDFRKVWQLIGAELQHFGGDSLVNFIRRNGVPYKEILTDVCKKIGVKTDFSADTVEIEKAMLAKLFEDSWENMSEAERASIRAQLKINGNLAGGAALSAIIAAIRLGGFMSYQVSLIVANAVARALLGRGLALAANAGLVRAIGIFAGPVGMAISALLTLPALTGPAYRVTLPAVVQIAAMRQQLLKPEEDIF